MFLKFREKMKKFITQIDFSIICYVFFLLILSLITILRLSFRLSLLTHKSSEFFYFYKHLFAVLLSLCLMFSFTFIKRDKIKKIGLILFIIFFLLTCATLVMGKKVNGVRRWLFGTSLQPSEFLKSFIIFPIAKFLHKSSYKKVILVMILSVGACLLQPDLGMSFLILAIVACLIWIKGEFFQKYINTFLGMLGLGIASGGFLAWYAIDRLKVFFGKKKGFQIEQVFKAYSNSSVLVEGRSIYIPESHYDFVFTEVCVTFGFFIGYVIILMNILIFINSLKRVLKRRYINKKDHDFIGEEDFLILCGLHIQFILQSFIHILSNLGVIPTKGMVLPFVSFGGCQLLVHGITFGMIISITRYYI